MTPWRRQVVLLGALGALLLLGCGPAVQCPPFSLPINAEAERRTSGTTEANVSVPTASGAGKAQWDSSGKAEWSCRMPCPRGSAIDYSETPSGRRLRCIWGPAAEQQRRDAGIDGVH